MLESFRTANGPEWIADGFRFLGPEETRKRREILEIFSKFLEQKSYKEVILPSFDYTSTFETYLRKEEFGSIFSTKDIEGNRISPPTDLTVLALKGMGGISKKEREARIYYTSQKIRDVHPKLGLQKETWQLGAERIGETNFLDLAKEILDLWNALQRKEKLHVVVSHTSILESLVATSQVPKEKLGIFFKLIKEKNVPELENFFRAFRFPEEVSKFIRDRILKVSLKDWTSLKSSEFFSQELLDTLKKLESVSETFLFDLGIVTDLEFYSGFLFKGFLESHPESIVIGGEYHTVYKKYNQVDMPCMGYAWNIESLE